MKLKIIKLFVAGLTLLSLLGAVFSYFMPAEELAERQLLFVTIGLDQAQVNDVSQYEIQRANEHFSDIVLSWTKQPNFASEIDASFNGRRLEKQNLLFTIDSDEEEAPLRFTEALQVYLDDFNASTNSSFKLALVRSHTESLTLSTQRNQFALFALLTVFFASSTIALRYANRR